MQSSHKANLLQWCSVSCETFETLERFAELLLVWNKTHNLVARSTTLELLWTRHIYDCAQLMPHIPTDSIIVDLGSGAGFPGIILSILGCKRLILIESNQKKAAFLHHAIQQFGLETKVISERIEDVVGLKADIITARALASLELLCELSYPFCDANTKALFLKGSHAQTELQKASMMWDFELHSHKSNIDDTGVILDIRNLQPKKAPHCD